MTSFALTVIQRTVQSRQNAHKTLNLPTQNGHTLRSRTFLNDSITGSLTFLEKETSRYALSTNPTRSGKPYPTPPRRANALETNALSLTPDCVYEEMQCTSSRVTAVISNTLVARHASSTTASENISIMKTPLLNKDCKGIDVKIIMSENDPANLRLYEAFYIRKCKPTLNSREECSEFADLLF